MSSIIRLESLEKYKEQFKLYIPAAIIPYLMVNLENYGLETRRLSIMFGSLGIDLSDTQTSEGINKVQAVVEKLQKTVYMMEGSLNKLVMDDKGSTFICIWGLSPFAHEDDAARATICGLKLQKELLRKETNYQGGCSCNIGIATGVVFAGVVGTSGSRREYSVLGDIVNLSARIMSYPKYVLKEFGRIFVDYNTKVDASNSMSFKYIDHLQFKGKNYMLPIFEPFDPEEEFSAKQDYNLYKIIRTHANPFFIDKKSEFQDSNSVSIGRNRLSKILLDKIDETISSNNYNSRIFFLEGPAGCGKSLFSRELISHIQQGLLLKNHKYKGPFLVGHVHPGIYKDFLNGFRNYVLPMAINLYSQLHNLNNSQALSRLIKENNSKVNDKLFILEKIFSTQLEFNYLNVPQYQKQVTTNDFVIKEEYPEIIYSPIFNFIITLFKKLVGQNEDGSLKKESDKISWIIIILDDANLMDKESWDLLFRLYENVKKLIIIANLRTNIQHNIAISSHPLETYRKLIKFQTVERIEFLSINNESLNELINSNLNNYFEELNEELKLQSNMGTENEREKKYKELKEQNNISSKCHMVNDDIIIHCGTIFQGNPYLCMQWIIQLIKSHMVIEREECFIPTEKYIKSSYLNDWSEVEVPTFCNRIITQLFDSLNNSMGVKCIISLKVASVLGKMFTLKQLKFLNPFRSEGMFDLIRRINAQEFQEIIEIVDDNGVSDMILRFAIPCSRELLYQRMTFREQKKGLHTMAVDFLQNNDIRIDVTLKRMIQKLKEPE